GCLDPEGMERLRRGASPIVKRGPYAGEKLTVDHIIPRAVSPGLDLVLANLSLLPHSSFISFHQRKSVILSSSFLPISANQWFPSSSQNFFSNSCAFTRRPAI
ncbi:MAG: hypothetical protein ACKO9H_17145, partial [Planctomycetota bacterium]